jgi:hypothetical protein
MPAGARRARALGGVAHLPSRTSKATRWRSDARAHGRQRARHPPPRARAAQAMHGGGGMKPCAQADRPRDAHRVLAGRAAIRKAEASASRSTYFACAHCTAPHGGPRGLCASGIRAAVRNGSARPRPHAEVPRPAEARRPAHPRIPRGSRAEAVELHDHRGGRRGGEPPEARRSRARTRRGRAAHASSIGGGRIERRRVAGPALRRGIRRGALHALCGQGAAHECPRTPGACSSSRWTKRAIARWASTPSRHTPG